MKQLFALLCLAGLLSCAKQRQPQIPSGTWTMIETNTDNGGAVQVQTFAPSSEITLEFKPDGQLLLNGSNPGQAMSPLWQYNRYQLLNDNIIRFYQTGGNAETRAYFTLNGDLFLNYLHVRCPYEEKFLRIK